MPGPADTGGSPGSGWLEDAAAAQQTGAKEGMKRRCFSSNHLKGFHLLVW